MKWDESGSKNVSFNFGGQEFEADVDFDSKYSYQGGPVRYPVIDVTLGRNDFKSRLKTMKYGGGTPLSETLYENYKVL